MNVTKRLLPVLLLVAAGNALADSSQDVYRTLGIDPQRVLAGTTLVSKVTVGREKQIVALTSYMTGRKSAADSVNVRLDVLRRAGTELIPLFERDYGEVRGAAVAEGNLQLIDLDLDGVQEIIVSFATYEDPLIEQRAGEILASSGEGFRVVWEGSLDYDATRAARDVPPSRRDRFAREIDLIRTISARGRTLYINKTVLAVAGERLEPPREVEETFPLLEARDRP